MAALCMEPTVTAFTNQNITVTLLGIIYIAVRLAW